MPIGAPAKINLFLHVGDKRADGFHALESLVAFTRAGDELDFVLTRGLSLTLDGPFAEGLMGEGNNLVLRAAQKLAAKGNVETRAHISLTKNLPVASGIGGGSADAAAALRGLNALWNLNLPASVLQEIAEEIGSDIPVCVESQPAWMEGRGELVAPLDQFPEMPVVLVNPGVAVPTGPVFAALQRRSGTMGLRPRGRLSSQDDVLHFLGTTRNDLEEPALRLAPAIGVVLESLQGQAGALLARMSGSGATCFAIFGDNIAAEKAAQLIRAAHPRWWVTATVLSGTA